MYQNFRGMSVNSLDITQNDVIAVFLNRRVEFERKRFLK